MRNNGLKLSIASLLLLGASTSALACVSAPMHGNCNDECSSWNNWFTRAACIYGATRNNNPAQLKPVNNGGFTPLQPSEPAFAPLQPTH